MDTVRSHKFARYSKHLSPFGQDVLNVMIKQWQKERDDNARRRHQHQRVLQPPPPASPRKRRILIFNPEPYKPNFIANSPMANFGPNTLLPNGHTDNENDAPFNFTDMMEARPFPPHVPTSTQLINPPFDVFEPESAGLGYSREDLLTTPSKPSITSPFKTENATFHEELKMPKVANMLQSVAETSDEPDKIGWDDMFDTDILSDLHGQTKDFENNERSNSANMAHQYIRKVQVKKTNIKKKGKETRVISDILVTPDILNKKVTKRKNVTKLKPKAAPKRPKKMSIENKEKRNHKDKAVRTWVNNVDPNNAVEEDIIDDPLKTENEVRTMKMVSDALINKSQKEKKKTVVQSKLANKDGVMKFKSPKDFGKGKLEIAAEGSNKSEEASNEVKKGKPKFVAPIKSQSSVKEPTYDIEIINETNIEGLTELDGDSVVMILLFSNGLCQLHGAAAGASAGLLLHGAATAGAGCAGLLLHGAATAGAGCAGLLLHGAATAGAGCAGLLLHGAATAGAGCAGLLLLARDHFYYIAKTVSNAKNVFEHILNNKEVICYEGKQLLIYLAEVYSIDLLASEFRMLDVKIGGSLMDPDNPPEDFNQLQRALSMSPSGARAGAGAGCGRQRAAGLGAALQAAAAGLRAALQRDRLWDLYENIEAPLVPIMADMEYRGVQVDVEALKTMEQVLLQRLSAAEQRCYSAAGRSFQINSPRQVRALLYGELRLDAAGAVRPTGAAGEKSTAEATLKSLMSVHPLPKLILEYRQLHKAHATFVSGIAQHVRDGVVRPTWLQTAAATGRVGCQRPNLQAVPRRPLRLPATAHEAAETVWFRSPFVARAGRVLLAADFRHVECRLAAHAAGDPRLRRALRAPDLFADLAALWLPAAGPAARELAKRAVYASLYGAGAARLAAVLQLPPAEARRTAASFHQTFPMLRRLSLAAAAACRAGGGRLATAAGRARRLPAIGSARRTERARAQRQAVNFLVQGSAADVCKAAMRETTRALRAARAAGAGAGAAGTGAGAAGGARLLLQLHDELVWELPQEELAATAEIVQAAMEGCGAACGLALRLPVTLRAGSSWGRMDELPPPGGAGSQPGGAGSQTGGAGSQPGDWADSQGEKPYNEY